MTPSVRQFIARQQFALGRFVEALGTAAVCGAEASRDTALNNRDAIIAECREILLGAGRHVGMLQVELRGADRSDVRVEVNGTQVAGEALGAPIPVAAGHVQITATQRATTVHRSLSVEAGATASVIVDFAAEASNASAAPVETHPRAVIPVGGVVVAGAGALVLGASAVFFVLRNDAIADCAHAGGRIECTTLTAYDRAQSAPTWNALTNVALVTGGVLVAAGAVWIAVTLTRRQPESRVARAAEWATGTLRW
jgi:hypothetical protein